MQTVIPLLIMIVGLLVSGCTEKQIAYVKDPQQWQQRYATDASVCDSQVQVVTGNAATPENWSREMKDDFVRCMSSKGWSHVREKGFPTTY
jgi:hypothetical protein